MLKGQSQPQTPDRADPSVASAGHSFAAPAVIRRRRQLVLALNIVTIAVLFAAMARLLSYGGGIALDR